MTDHVRRPPTSIAAGISIELRDRHYAWLDVSALRIDGDLRHAQDRFFDEWEHLEPDEYLHTGASFRRRRFALFSLDPRTDVITPLPQHTYFQALDVNVYAGGVERRFAPFRPTALTNEFLHELIRRLFRQLPLPPGRRRRPWIVDVHQIRVIATGDEHGEPAPEGPHHDGEEFGVAQLIQRRNVEGGRSTVYSNEGAPIASSTLREPLDALLWWDPKVMHGVSPIRPIDPGEPGIRDMLIMGYDEGPASP